MEVSAFYALSSGPSASIRNSRQGFSLSSKTWPHGQDHAGIQIHIVFSSKADLKYPTFEQLPGDRLKNGIDLHHFPCQKLDANRVYGTIAAFAYNFMRFMSLVTRPGKIEFAKK